jgi:hypothetical protein
MGQESTARQLYSVASWACLTSCAETECEQMYCSFQNLRIISNHVNSLRPIIPISLPVLWANKIRQHFFFTDRFGLESQRVTHPRGDAVTLCSKQAAGLRIPVSCDSYMGYPWVTHGLPMGYPHQLRVMQCLLNAGLQRYLQVSPVLKICYFWVPKSKLDIWVFHLSSCLTKLPLLQVDSHVLAKYSFSNS